MYTKTTRKVHDTFRNGYGFKIRYTNPKRVGYGFHLQVHETLKYTTRKYTTRHDCQEHCSSPSVQFTSYSCVLSHGWDLQVMDRLSADHRFLIIHRSLRPCIRHVRYVLNLGMQLNPFSSTITSSV